MLAKIRKMFAPKFFHVAFPENPAYICYEGKIGTGFQDLNKHYVHVCFEQAVSFIPGRHSRYWLCQKRLLYSSQREARRDHEPDLVPCVGQLEE